jgi:hypothetical protein
VAQHDAQQKPAKLQTRLKRFIPHCPRVVGIVRIEVISSSQGSGVLFRGPGGGLFGETNRRTASLWPHLGAGERTRPLKTSYALLHKTPR